MSTQTFPELPVELSPLERAIAVVGSQDALAEAVGVKSPSITGWKRRGVPPDRCRQVEQAADGAVTRYELRPDVFGADPATRTEVEG